MRRVQGRPRRDLQNDKAQRTFPQLSRAFKFTTCPLLSQVQWNVCPQQPEHVTRESCLYLRKDGSELKHLYYSFIYLFWRRNTLAFVHTRQSHLQALTRHGETLLIYLKLAFFSLSLQTTVPTPTHLSSNTLISDLPLPAPRTKKHLNPNQVLFLMNSLTWGKFYHNWASYNAFCVCCISPYLPHPSCKMYLVKTLMFTKALL